MATMSELIEATPDLDVETFVTDGDIVTDLIIIARVQRLTDTADALCIGSTNHTGHIVWLGMLHKALLQMGPDAEDDDDA